MNKTIIDGIHKTEITEIKPGLYLVSVFEKMGENFVMLGIPEFYSACALMELFENEQL